MLLLLAIASIGLLLTTAVLGPSKSPVANAQDSIATNQIGSSTVAGNASGKPTKAGKGHLTTPAPTSSATASNLPTATPTASTTAAPSATSTPTATSGPTPNPNPTAAPTPTPTAAPTPTPTAAPTPTPTPAPIAGTHYLSPSGTDAGNCSASPCRTFSYALSSAALPCGQRLLVSGSHATPYVENITTLSISHCTAGAPITVQAASGQDPVIEGLLWLHSPSYWTINDIDVTWNPANTSDEHMVKMEGGVGWHYINSELWGAHSYAALLISDDNGVSPVTWTVADNCIHDTYQSNSTNQDQLIYANPGLGGSGGVITRNLLFNATNGQGIKLGGPSSGSGGADYMSVTYNTVYNTSQGMLVNWQSHDNTISRNIIDKVNLSLSSVYGDIRGYDVSGLRNVASNNVGYEAASLIYNDPGYVGVQDGGGNIFPLSPQWGSTGSCSGFHPLNATAAAYGRWAP
jgi:hypothetical protein